MLSTWSTASRPASASGPSPDRSERLARLALRATLGALVGALALVGASLGGGRPTLALGPEAAPWLAVSADRLAVLLLVLVIGVSATVQGYALRYLRTEPWRDRFVGLTVTLTASSMVLVAAATPATLALAWVVSGAAVVGLVGLRRDDPSVAADLRLVRWGVGLGDVSLVVAVVAVLGVAGSFDLRDPGAVAAAASELGGWATPVALLVVVAALSRCAQMPLPGWLPLTVGAPTPVSALLHAGVVNGGGLLLIVVAPLLSAATGAWALVALAAGATAVWSVLTMSVSADVKGELARSTSAQMGFMLVTVAAGLPAAAVVHLVGHGLYKSARFLGSGAVVHEATHQRTLPPPTTLRAPTVAVLALLALAPGLVLATAVGALGWGAAEAALLVFAWAAIVAGTAGWARRRGDAAGWAWALVGSTAAALAYVGLVHTVKTFLGPIGATTPAGPGAWALVGLAVALLAVVGIRAGLPGTAGLADRLYVWALGSTHRPAPSRPTRSRANTELLRIGSPSATAPASGPTPAPLEVTR
ncbi:proton-conducting transporter membrane subunit [Rhabdothermincola salaria]|uniref:proton-conducting transporter transmembrane domain-containing protein n=1 Tax=Rhabdothermincola salaria TaxID=2903142 RepID=UPI001E41BFC6|nr:proton-conducting transporter membrane subunit [Rhabdothermincola salaria]MCD9624338.1 hypothetical protein [Rhabdothermincola salaria]